MRHLIRYQLLVTNGKISVVSLARDLEILNVSWAQNWEAFAQDLINYDTHLIIGRRSGQFEMLELTRLDVGILVQSDLRKEVENFSILLYDRFRTCVCILSAIVQTQFQMSYGFVHLTVVCLARSKCL